MDNHFRAARPSATSQWPLVLQHNHQNSDVALQGLLLTVIFHVLLTKNTRNCTTICLSQAYYPAYILFMDMKLHHQDAAFIFGFLAGGAELLFVCHHVNIQVVQPQLPSSQFPKMSREMCPSINGTFSYLSRSGGLAIKRVSFLTTRGSLYMDK